MSQSCAEQVIKVQYDVCHGESMCETQKSGTGGRDSSGKEHGVGGEALAGVGRTDQIHQVERRWLGFQTEGAVPLKALREGTV